ncbi:MAG: hypothetical protein A3C84_02175 [Candidatus Ryanbacteria bacterium RIFCSPHIGHO2_02_FULL_48_12]|uniref:M23ase beta-sheet core domain-containing protein n=1 Tax=Candidatus Ryanbacteria bacterium RIFCSPHIGHO2_01_FULL_48_27 TaxID=1802115 RepID=A0A1G2G4B8_9BACT|nr:MAG: hypothetical protein A2756_04605 [Candidatus Ryanbacteria bacterium RIFCSPHIGHO2_01_FULL_48_27]OGZ49260.1 MAG: hypothetical protein A3C84_02175 [Candidatus Ryanbacteria bacterium RIFCSPHIGHO2_02_FULL_48_12]
MSLKPRTYKVVFLLSLIVCGIFFYARVTKSETIEEMRERIKSRNAEIAELEKEIALYQKNLDATSQKSKTLKGEIIRLTTQIKKLNADITLTQRRIDTAELEIRQLSSEIKTKEQKIVESREAIAGLIKSLDELTTDSLAELLLKNLHISDFFSDVENMQRLNQAIQINLISLRDLKIDLEEEKSTQVVKKQELEGLEDQLLDRKGLHESGKREQEQLLSVTKNQEATYQKMLQDKEKKRREVLDEIQKIEDELRKQIDPASLPEGRSGVLAWPVKGVVMLTQSFGSTPESKILYNGKPHNGVDLKASMGTPIHAAEAGVVRAIGDTDMFPRCLSYGKYVLIDHPNGLSTLYAHLSLIKVSKGDTVTREQLIGYSGATGYATGPHLHFTVYDSKTVEFKSSSVANSTCKLLPYGGYLNPLAYL